MSIVLLILTIMITVSINRFYHKIFSITYFGFQPLITEWIVCFIIGMAIAGSIFRLLGFI